MSAFKFTTFSSHIKTIQANTKCRSNKKIMITVQRTSINKNKIRSLLNQYFNFIHPDLNIDFTKMKINSVKDKYINQKRTSYIKNNNNQFAISNIYRKKEIQKRFIITFNNFKEKVKLLDLIEK